MHHPLALQHARKLCGIVPYSLPEVKPVVSARYIFVLVNIIARLMESKNYQRIMELRRENAELLRELAAYRREMDRWGMARPGARGQRDLQFERESPA